MSGKAKITFAGAVAAQNTTIEFVSWQGRIQKPKKVVEYTTRLGGSRLVISNIKKESQLTTSIAVMSSTGADVTDAVIDLEDKIKTLRKKQGDRFTWTDENGIEIERCYLVDFSYVIKAYDGASKALATISFQIMTDLGENDHTLG